jgi:hypothetical protein
MSQFSKSFLRDSPGAIQIAMFGKHPAWDDHIDEIGLTTQSLVYTKRILYSEGIATQLASGAWDQIERSGNAIEFNHHFVWGRGDRSIIGGLWASTDGKGRTRFPMAICFQIEVDTLQALALYWAPLESLGQQCRAATSREAVLNLVRQTSDCLNGPDFPKFAPLDNLFSSGCDPFSDASIQSLEQLADQLNSNRKPSNHFRLPPVCDSARESIGFWSGFTDRHASKIPTFTIAANGREPVDLIVGEPSSDDFFGLRAREAALAFSSVRSAHHPSNRAKNDARNYLQSFRLGPGAASQQRPWLSRLFRGNR